MQTIRLASDFFRPAQFSEYSEFKKILDICVIMWYPIIRKGKEINKMNAKEMTPRDLFELLEELVMENSFEDIKRTTLSILDLLETLETNRIFGIE